MSDSKYEEEVRCAKCLNIAEDTLMLTCDHHLCLNCATANLLREEKKGLHKYKVS
jgi:hypothetical protein